jgi:Rrf2 family protein
VLSLTRKADYAVVALAELAASRPGKLSARELSDRTHVPLPVLTNILHQLLHHHLVTSTMGVKGGYCVARSPEQITLAEVIDAIEGGFRLALCCTEQPSSADPSCDLEHNCRVREPVRRVHSSLRQFLSRITLAQLVVGQTPVSLGVEPVERYESSAATLVGERDERLESRPPKNWVGE